MNTFPKKKIGSLQSNDIARVVYNFKVEGLF